MSTEQCVNELQDAVCGMKQHIAGLEARVATLEPEFKVGDVVLNYRDRPLNITSLIYYERKYGCDDGTTYGESELRLPAPEPKSPLAERLRALIETWSPSYGDDGVMGAMKALLEDEE